MNSLSNRFEFMVCNITKSFKALSTYRGATYLRHIMVFLLAYLYYYLFHFLQKYQ